MRVARFNYSPQSTRHFPHRERGNPWGYGARSWSWFVARGSWLVARGSWLVARGSWLVARGRRSMVASDWRPTFAAFFRGQPAFLTSTESPVPPVSRPAVAGLLTPAPHFRSPEAAFKIGLQSLASSSAARICGASWLTLPAPRVRIRSPSRACGHDGLHGRGEIGRELDARAAVRIRDALGQQLRRHAGDGLLAGGVDGQHDHGVGIAERAGKLLQEGRGCACTGGAGRRRGACAWPHSRAAASVARISVGWWP